MPVSISPGRAKAACSSTFEIEGEASPPWTNNVLIVEQGALGTSYGGFLADELQRRVFDWLDQPIMRVHGGEASPSISTRTSPETGPWCSRAIMW